MKAARKLLSDPNSGEAYWGLAYYNYAGGNTKLWRCPAAKTSDEWRETGIKWGAEFWLDASYGINGPFFKVQKKGVLQGFILANAMHYWIQIKPFSSRMPVNKRWTAVQVTH